MILITGATGHLGTAVVENLLKELHPQDIAIYARDAKKAKKWADLGISVRIGDFKDIDALDQALKDVSKILLISTNDEDAFEQHKNVIVAALNAKVERFYYAGGSLNHNVETSKLGFLKDAYFRTENYIRSSGIPYAICQNGLYAEVVPFFIGEDLPTNGIYFPSGSGQSTFALRAEMGEAIAKIMLMNSPINTSYTLTGNRSYSFADIASILSNASGKNISFESPDPEDFVNHLDEYGVEDNEILFSSIFAELIKNEEYLICDNTLEQILGRKPTALEDYLKNQYKL